jgi:hypothetical protein
MICWYLVVPVSRDIGDVMNFGVIKAPILRRDL